MAQVSVVQGSPPHQFSHHDLIRHDATPTGKGKFVLCKQARIPTSWIDDFLLGGRSHEEGVEWDVINTRNGFEDGHSTQRSKMYRGHK